MRFVPDDKALQKISKVLRSEDAQDLVKWLQSELNDSITTLKQTRDEIDFKRAQGRVEILELILKKREV